MQDCKSTDTLGTGDEGLAVEVLDCMLLCNRAEILTGTTIADTIVQRRIDPFT